MTQSDDGLTQPHPPATIAAQAARLVGAPARRDRAEAGAERLRPRRRVTDADRLRRGQRRTPGARRLRRKTPQSQHVSTVAHVGPDA